MQDNRTTITVITSTVAIMAFTCVISVCVLAFLGVQIPPELNTIASGLSGSLVSMLVKTSPTQEPGHSNLNRASSDPTPVVVTNDTQNAVPTTETNP